MLSCLPLVSPLLPNCIAQPLHYWQAEVINDTMSSPYELLVQQTVHVKDYRELFD
jgi:hypothetical protein